jgi:hypothetical protein
VSLGDGITNGETVDACRVRSVDGMALTSVSICDAR